jgi:hypothetical protein
MGQPVWKTPAGSLSTIAEGIFYQIPLQAEDPSDPENPVFYRLIAGRLPDGIQVRKTGIIEGIPKPVAITQGVPTEVARDITSKFAVRAYTERVINGVIVVDRIADRTFELTVTGNDIPDFITPPGNIGTFYDGTEVAIQIEYTDPDPDDDVITRIITGQLPPGLAITRTGLIAGVIPPLVGPPGTAQAGWSTTPNDEYPWDFSTRSASRNYQFTVEITDGKDSNLRTYSIFVYSRDSMSADTTDFTADNTFITADVSPTRTPILLTPPGDLGRVRGDNFYAFKFDAIDFDGDAIEYSITVGAGVGFDNTLFDQDGIGFDRGNFSLPPGLTINPDTGWFYGYIPDQGPTETTYRFAVRVKKRDNPTVISGFYYFTITIIGNIETEVIWLTEPDLGVINNGAVSMFAIEAINVGGRSLQYRILQGSDSKLPQGLTLLPSGLITGKVSFNTFALDGGTTTFDSDPSTRFVNEPTTFDMTYEFTVNAYAPQAENPGYRVTGISVTNGGSGYTGTPTVTISSPGAAADAIQATAGAVTIVNGVITAIALGNPGRGYVTPPTVTITGGGGAGAAASAQVQDVATINAVSVFRRFTITVNRAFNTPYEKLYIKAMPPIEDRALIDQLIYSQDIFPVDLIYRADDPNFGVSQSVVYDHAYGLTPGSLDEYANAMVINHYWKNLVLGQVKTAQALDANGNIIYEVIYSQVVDDLVNDQGESVSKEITWPYTIQPGDITEVYPNSLINMRDQIIDQVGQTSSALPLWMTSKQADGRVLGFTPAWVIAYVKPGQSGRVLYNVQQQFGDQLNKVDFKADRYELDRSQTHNWDPVTDRWIPYPPAATTFDQDTTVFDGTATRFIAPADQYTTTDVFDKYLLYPRTNILG